MTVSIGDIDPRHIRVIPQHGHVALRIAQGVHLTFDTQRDFDEFARTVLLAAADQPPAGRAA